MKTIDDLGFSKKRRDFLKGLALGTAGLASSLGLSSCSPSLNNTGSNTIKGMLRISDEASAGLYPVFSNGAYIVKDFTHLTKVANLGLSPEIITNHLGLYKKYVDKVNKSEVQMKAGNIDDFSMKNLAFSLNGMALHDIYFSNMNVDNGKLSSALKQAIDKSYGSVESYMTNLVQIAEQVSGWSITGVNLLNGQILNYGLNNHSDNFPNYVMPILALDVYEHAYVMDFSKKGKSKYIEVFKRIIDWDMVSQRFDHISSKF